MKYQILNIKLLILICLLVPMFANAVRPALVKPNFKTTWMIDFDLTELKQENILAENNQIQFLQSDLTSLKSIPQDISRIHMYGNGLNKNTSAVLFGTISGKSLEDFIIHRVSKSDPNIKLLDKKEIASGTQLISKLSLGKSEEERVIYYAKVISGIWTVSSNIIELRRWMDHPHSYMNFKRGEKNLKLLSFWIDVKPTLENLKQENEEDGYLLQSNLLKQTKDVYATIQRNAGYLYFATELTATSKKEANNLVSSIDSLLSEEMNSNTKVLSKMLSTLQKEQNGKKITVSSTISNKVFKD